MWKGGYIILFLIIQFSCELFLDTNHPCFSQEVLKKTPQFEWIDFVYFFCAECFSTSTYLKRFQTTLDWLRKHLVLFKWWQTTALTVATLSRILINVYTLWWTVALPPGSHQTSVVVSSSVVYIARLCCLWYPGEKKMWQCWKHEIEVTQKRLQNVKSVLAGKDGYSKVSHGGKVQTRCALKDPPVGVPQP